MPGPRALAVAGYTKMEDEMVDSWLAADARHAISPLPPEYRLANRLDTLPAPHHMGVWSGQAGRYERLRQTPLYRADLDLVVLDSEGEAAAFGLFWFDAGAERVKTVWDQNNLAVNKLYTDVGFTSVRRCSLLSLPGSTQRRY